MSLLSCVAAGCRDTLLHGQPMRRPSIKSMDIPHGMREVVEQECNASQVCIHAAVVWPQWRHHAPALCCQLMGPNMRPCGHACARGHGRMLCGLDGSGVKVLLLLLQMGALRAGLDGTPLVLIQGPPGTGGCRHLGGNRQHTAGSARVASLGYVYVQQARSAAAGWWGRVLFCHHLLASFPNLFSWLQARHAPS